MIDDAATWHRLAALLPVTEAQDVRDCWDIGEQEAGLDLLVSGLLVHGVAVGETVRAELSALAEAWGERESLTPRILECRADDGPAGPRLVEQGDAPADALVVGDAADLVLVPWIACTACGRVLMRAHTREPWGGLSYLAQQYVITSPDRATVLRRFPADSVDRAWTALLNERPRPPIAGDSSYPV